MSGFAVKLLGNPLAQNIDIYVENNNSPHTTATLYNTVGAKITAWYIGNRSGTVQMPISIPIASGIYLLKITDGKQTETLRIVKK